jgi:hypothetical protein
MVSQVPQIPQLENGILVELTLDVEKKLLNIGRSVVLREGLHLWRREAWPCPPGAFRTRFGSPGRAQHNGAGTRCHRSSVFSAQVTRLVKKRITNVLRKENSISGPKSHVLAWAVVQSNPWTKVSVVRIDQSMSHVLVTALDLLAVAEIDFIASGRGCVTKIQTLIEVSGTWPGKNHLRCIGNES